MPAAKLTKNQWFAAICLVLAVATFILYLPVRYNGFTNFDDDGYVTENSHVTSGLNWPNIRWGFTHVHEGYWIPLTWISHMTDCQLFGLNAGGHHLVSVLFHIANTLLIFLWLYQLTGTIWRSAFVAALFAWHPLHVESVAWACERKDVLSMFFWMLTLIAYAYYVKARMSLKYPIAVISYLLAMLLFACGLMSKPMVVTLPCVLLLVDFWPLGRFGTQGGFSLRNASMLLLEKIPFFALAAVGSAIGFLTQTVGGAVSSDTLPYRVTNALASYLRYISKIFWPTDLSIFYPFQPHGVMLSLAIISVILLMIFSIIFTLMSRQWPYLFVGWFWFLGTLTPVIGVIQAGSQSMADRFTYIPSVGMYVLVTWGLADFLGSSRRKPFLAIAAAIVLAVCLVLTSIQITYWRSSITVFKHALEVTADNYVADACLGQALDAAGDDDNALIYCQRAVQINPSYTPEHFFLGIVLWKKGDIKDAYNELSIASKANASNRIIQYHFGEFLLEQGRLDEAVARFNAALDDAPDFAEAHNALGKTFLKQGKFEQATTQLSQAVTLAPNNAQFHYDLGTVLLHNSKTDQAIAEFSEAVRLQPDFALAHENFAVALAGQGELDQAIEQFSKVVQLRPDDPEARFNLGFACLQDHQPATAAAQFSEEVRLTPDQTKAHYRLAQALEQQNDFTNAVVHYRQALRLTPDFPVAKKELDEILAAHPELR